MHTLQIRPADRHLREFVRAYGQRDLDAGDSAVTFRCPARLEQELEFQFRAPFRVLHANGANFVTPAATIVGSYTQGGCRITFSQRVETFGVFFQPAGFSKLFGIPMSELSNRAYDAESVVGNEISTWWQRMAEASRFEQRVKISEEVLAARAASMPRASVMNGMSRIADWILSVNGATRIADVAQDSGMSLRQFERKFVTQLNVPPKLFARVARFQTALDLKLASPARSWLAIAHEVNYHDQMHMIRDFRDLAGDAPSGVFSDVGDMRPPALLAQSDDQETRLVSFSGP